jgi:flagellar operon protein
MSNNSFQINSVQRNTANGANSSSQSNTSTQGTSFAEELSRANVQFSNHAQKRIETRSIELGEDGLERLSDAVDKAEKHGARESLILMDDLAFIVNVTERKVVTTVNVNQRSEGVFTQIDSVVLANPAQKTQGS